MYAAVEWTSLYYNKSVGFELGSLLVEEGPLLNAAVHKLNIFKSFFLLSLSEDIY